MTNESSVETVQGWFAGRVPEGWFSGLEVSFEGDQIVVVGKLADPVPDHLGSPEQRAGFASGRISRFRGATRRERIHIAREAEHRFQRPVTWGAALGEVRETFNPGSLRGAEGAEGPKGGPGQAPETTSF